MNRLREVTLILIISFLIPMVLYATEEKPIAVFSFDKNTYQVSEPITVKENSYSKEGNKITQREWKAKIGGKYKTTSSISTLLKGVMPGPIEVYLRVKDAKGIWSNWISQKIEIQSLKPLKITNFQTEYEIYAMGEKLRFTYECDNPNDLAIKSERWRYKNLTTGGSTVSTKPRYFTKPGTYEVTLELQDEWGNWSDKATCKVQVSSERIKRDGNYLFNKGKTGDLIADYVDKDYNTFSSLEDVQITDKPGMLIVSNSPESISSSGILYADTSEGEGRLVVHHLNQTSVTKKLMVIATTSREQPVQLKVSNEAIVGPHKNILKIGQTAVKEYFKGNLEKTYTLTPGKLTVLYDSSRVKGWENEEVISGMLDFESDGPVEWTIVAMDIQSPIESISKLRVLEKDVHIRGTFPVIERQYTINIKELKMPGKITVGGESDEWLMGEDALTGEIVYNRGNYGLPVQIKLRTDEDMGIILNARGGSYLGAIRWRNKVVGVPNEEILTDKKLAALIGKAKAGEVTEWTYMLPNGSSAPVLFGFIPAHLWGE